LEHAAEVMGGVVRVCLGGDFTRRLWQVIPPPPEPRDGLMPAGLEPGTGLEGLAGSDEYPNLVAALRRRGWSEAQVAAVTHESLVTFLRSALGAA
ncbi:MAG: membrane dipeptidase, partial [Gaiella sp.]